MVQLFLGTFSKLVTNDNWQFEAKRSLPLITSSFDEDELFPIVNGNYKSRFCANECVCNSKKKLLGCCWLLFFFLWFMIILAYLAPANTREPNKAIVNA